jgi:hypothetical protein
MFDDIFGHELQWYFHIFIPIKRCLEIHIFDVGAVKLGIGRADNTVPHNFS